MPEHPTAAPPPEDREQLLHRLQTAERARDAAEKRCRRLLMALAGSVLLLVAAVGGSIWWLRQHLLNDQAERTRRQAAVERGVERADALLGDDGPEELRERVRKLREDLDQVRRDQEMVQRLTDIRVPVAGGQGGRGEQAADQLYRQAFRDWGLDPEEQPPEEVSQRIRTSPIGPALTAALDDWARVKRNGAEGERLRSLASLTDSDPWRRQVRQALAGKDREAVQRFARAEEVDRQPPSGIILLAEALHGVGVDEQRLKVLRSAQLRYPEDFALCCELAGAYATLQPPHHDEAIGNYRAALALRPDSAAAHAGLGTTLLARQRFEEAIACFREAIRLKPDDADVHYGLAVALHKRGEFDEAVRAYREALRLDPKRPGAVENLDRALKGEGPK
jgi:Flp pilus assembly protein TadD